VYPPLIRILNRKGHILASVLDRDWDRSPSADFKRDEEWMRDRGFLKIEIESRIELEVEYTTF
jgi:hypothetical protein